MMKKVWILGLAAVCLAAWSVVGVVSAADQSDDVVAIVDAYVGAWNEADDDARLALLEKSWANDGVYTDPTAEVKGRDGLLKHTGEFVNNPEMKGFSLERVSGVDVHHQVLRFDWALKDPSGAVVVAGVDYGVLDDDGRFSSITGFFGPVPEMKE
jgi:hypothetical protein